MVEVPEGSIDIFADKLYYYSTINLILLLLEFSAEAYLSRISTYIARIDLQRAQINGQ